MSNQKQVSIPDRNCQRQPPDSKSQRKKAFRIRIITRGAVIRLAVLAAALTVFCLWAYFTMIKMPGKSYTGPLPALTDDSVSLRDELRRDVERLAEQIGERNIWYYHNLTTAADFLESSLAKAGYKVHRQNYQVENRTCSNIEVENTGTKHPDQIVIIGAHYDSVLGSPGANDNASAVAATLALARRFADKKTARTLRFVLFVNEEPPFFQTDQMGSLVYAKSCRERGDQVVAMLSFETIGYYTDQPNSQKYPFPFNLVYPSTGNFLGFVGNFSSRKLLYRVIASFRKNCKFPSQGGALPEIIAGINWSDHQSFWRHGYPAIMLTDTAAFRYPYYHSPEDTPDKIDYDRLTIVTTGLQAVVTNLTSPSDQ